MSKDLEVIGYLLDSMLGASNKLDKAVSLNEVEKANSIKKSMIEINKKILEELS